ncbi:leukocyte immunoglobulin-like receptor subfamily B member 1 [Monodelphis domestica]|uniref:leukocyte immunoglobulin-like receptor subfamily B member 1 n=1 Tax=Monodelphis domestica TaxID=13616 RepID=UPI0024E23CAF|nr:leukocyte immunoglobulin-like receptor subfamily B member 1 [Monodelphis domestica]
MTPALSVLLCLDGLPKPSLRAENGSMVPHGGAVTLRWSERSDPLELVVTEEGRNQHVYDTFKVLNTLSLLSHWIFTTALPGLYAPPSLAAEPRSEVAPGQNVTLQCRSEQWYDWCVLCKEGEEISCGRTWSHGWGRQADFLFPAVTQTQEGTYRCFGFYSSSPSQWSSPSAPLLLRVSGTSKDPHLPQSSVTPPTMTSPPRSLSCLQVGILVGISAFLILTFLLLSLLCLHCHCYRPRLGKGDKDTDIKTTRRSEQAGTTLEETMYAAVNHDRQTEEARQEEKAALQREAAQEVTYAQLDHRSLKCGAEPPPQSGPVEPSVYAVLQ